MPTAAATPSMTGTPSARDSGPTRSARPAQPSTTASAPSSAIAVPGRVGEHVEQVGRAADQFRDRARRPPTTVQRCSRPSARTTRSLWATVRGGHRDDDEPVRDQAGGLQRGLGHADHRARGAPRGRRARRCRRSRRRRTRRCRPGARAPGRAPRRRRSPPRRGSRRWARPSAGWTPTTVTPGPETARAAAAMASVSSAEVFGLITVMRVIAATPRRGDGGEQRADAGAADGDASRRRSGARPRRRRHRCAGARRRRRRRRRHRRRCCRPGSTTSVGTTTGSGRSLVDDQAARLGALDRRRPAARGRGTRRRPPPGRPCRPARRPRSRWAGTRRTRGRRRATRPRGRRRSPPAGRGRCVAAVRGAATRRVPAGAQGHRGQQDAGRGAEPRPGRRPGDTDRASKCSSPRTRSQVRPPASS